MQMRIRERNNTIEIQLSRLGGRQQVVLEALGGFEGAVVDRSKLESMSLRARADAMEVCLRAKTGERLDPSEIYRCLRRALFGPSAAFLPTIANRAAI
ncbi:MAG: hypothetical protein ACREBN_03940 [Burkholderiaceae bacterium]